MTVSNESFRTLQSPDGINLVFTTDFHIQGVDSTDWDDQVRFFENGVASLISFTISLVSEAGFTVTFATPPAAGVLSIVRRKRNTQGSSYPVAQPFPPKAVEESLDDLTLQMQDVEAIGEFGLRQPIWEVKRNMVLPDIATRALRVQTYDQDGNADVSDLVAVPIEILNCIVNFNASPYKAVAGEADSTAAIQGALNSGATYVTGCPGTYNVNGLTIPPNVSLIAPGVILNGITGTEGNFLAFADAGASILAENIHIKVQQLQGFNDILIQNYINCSIEDTLIDGVFNGLTIGASGNSAQADMFGMKNVIIRNCLNGGIRPSTGPNKDMNITFNNVSVELCSFMPIEFGTVSGSWTGGSVKNNTVSPFRGALECNSIYGTRGFNIVGVDFDNNGNATLDALDIYIARCAGLNITGCSFKNSLTGAGRSWAIGTGSGINVTGMNVVSNNVTATDQDANNFIGIQLTTGSVNNFVAANTILGLTGGQVAEVVDVANNYHIVNGVKQ